MRPAQIHADTFDVAFAVRDPRIERTSAADPMVQRQRRIAGLTCEHVALAHAGAVGQRVIGVGGVEPAAVVAHHQTAGAIVVQRLQIGAGAVVFGLIKVGIQADAVGQAPVDGAAVLQRIANLACGQP
ncbi:hypothetical protein D3C85_826210 [compost metagenome]